MVERYRYSVVLPVDASEALLLDWAASTMGMMQQRGVRPREIAWWTEDGPKGTRRAVAERMEEEGCS